MISISSRCRRARRRARDGQRHRIAEQPDSTASSPPPPAASRANESRYSGSREQQPVVVQVQPDRRQVRLRPVRATAHTAASPARDCENEIFSTITNGTRKNSTSHSSGTPHDCAPAKRSRRPARRSIRGRLSHRRPRCCLHPSSGTPACRARASGSGARPALVTRRAHLAAGLQAYQEHRLVAQIGDLADHAACPVVLLRRRPWRVRSICSGRIATQSGDHSAALIDTVLEAYRRRQLRAVHARSARLAAPPPVRRTD